MFTLPASVRIYVAAEPVDLRRYPESRIMWSHSLDLVALFLRAVCIPPLHSRHNSHVFSFPP